ncbi:MAG TPA: sigma-70 family RNA polymerase sigma factor [Vicinamibacterales bacterium]|nr:sigma-70 family RNA polymerase sigma factor [Vicinamibacterales bacterium]
MTQARLDRDAEHLLRDLAPQVLGAVTRRYRDFTACEDAVQDALIAASQQWPRDGMPGNPRGWLIQVASRRMVDQIRSDSARREREHAAALDLGQLVAAASVESRADQDETLTLLFMCCHPALTNSSAVALTLRAVGGLTTAQIANAFLVPEATMAQRISRAKQTIRASGVPFEAPAPRTRGERLDAVLHVLYLIFNEGYTSSVGASLQRVDLSSEAIRLARAVRQLVPDDAEVSGLLALMLLTDARRLARTGPAGELIPLPRQDRSKWNREAIAEGTVLLTAALAKGRVGPYQLQAAVAALHDEAPRHEDTDWPQIAALYALLERMSDNPMVTLNRAIAVAMVQGPAAGLEMLDALAAGGRLAGTHRLDAVRGHLLELAGDRDGAVRHYLAAANRTTNTAERNYLLTQAATVREAPPAR